MIRPARPLGVALIAMFMLADAVVGGLEALGSLPELVDRGPLLDASDVSVGVLAAIAALKVIAAVGLWVGSKRAWVLTMLLVGLSLVILIALYLSGVDEPRYLRLAINVVIAFYLNQGLVHDYFERRDGAIGEGGEMR
jgi:uncharacterized membrane protein (DUF2068 family)